MYKVFRDPEGRKLEKNSESCGTKRKESAVNCVKEDYIRQIESLNEEIKALTDTVRTFNKTFYHR